MNSDSSTKMLEETLPLLLTSKQVHDLTSLGERTIWRLSHSGRMPAALKIGGCVRFRRDEITAWIKAGCACVDG